MPLKNSIQELFKELEQIEDLKEYLNTKKDSK